MSSKKKSAKLQRAKQENGWSVQLKGSEMPEYKAELDPYCPRAQVRKYNQDKKLDAESAADKAKKAAKWIEKKIKTNFEEVPTRFNPTLRNKAKTQLMSNDGAKENVAEIEVLQKVIVRENLLEELRKLLSNQTDVTGCLGEVIELVKAIRYQTVEIVEDIAAWQITQPTPRAFLYRGMNYLVKVFEDLTFLDQYEDIVQRFCFEFTCNPLAYRGGGDIATGPGGSAMNEGVNRLTEQYQTSATNFDGLEVVRLRSAEKVIQLEFDRLDREKLVFAKQTQQNEQRLRNVQRRDGDGDQSFEEYGQEEGEHELGVAMGELGMESIVGAGSIDGYGNNGDTLSYAATNNIQRAEMESREKSRDNTVGNGKGKKVPAADRRKWKQKFNPRKVKMERISTLTTEADELKAMETHMEDQISSLVQAHHDSAAKRKIAENRRREAQSMDREAAAQHLTVEISMHTADMQDVNSQIKELQRQMYFVSIERNRKRKVAKKLKEEIAQVSLEEEIIELWGYCSILVVSCCMWSGALDW